MRSSTFAVATSLCMIAPLLVLACSDSSEGTPAEDDAGGDSALPYDAGGDAANAEDAAIDGAPRTLRVCTEEGWCHTRLPPGEKLRDVWGDGQGGVWVVSEQGNILRWDGKGWRVSSSGNGLLEAIWGTSPADLWAGGAGGLFRGRGTADQEIAWNRVDLGEDEIEIEDIGGTSADDVWAVGKYAAFVHENGFRGSPRAFHLQERNGTWERDPIQPFADSIYYPYFTEIHRVWTTADGDLWIHGGLVFPPGHPTQVPRIDSLDFQYRRPHGTSRWEEKPWPVESISPLVGIEIPGFSGAGAVGNDIWLFGYFQQEVEPYASGFCYWTGQSAAIAGSADWTFSVSAPNTPHLGTRGTAVWGVSANDVWVVGVSGRLEHWDGAAWKRARTVVDGEPITSDLRAIWGRSADDIWVVGGRHALHKVSLEEAARLNAEAAAGGDGGI